MKKSVLFFVVVVLFFFSCKKENIPVVIDINGIRAQLVLVPTITKDEVAALLSSKLKSSTLVNENLPIVLVQIFDLSPDVYQINDVQAIKYAVYYEIDQNGYRQKYLTIKQCFPVKNGVVDTSVYTLGYEVGCSLSRDFQLSSTGNVNQMTFFFHFNDGKQFTYYSNGGNASNIKLPPLSNGKWQLMVNFYDGDLQQQFTSDLIDYNNQSNIINLRLQVKNKNIISIIKIDKNLIKGAYNIWVGGYDPHAVYQGLSFPVMFDESMPNLVSFEVPFNIWDINISTCNGCIILSTKNAKVTVMNSDGTITYIM